VPVPLRQMLVNRLDAERQHSPWTRSSALETKNTLAKRGENRKRSRTAESRTRTASTTASDEKRAARKGGKPSQSGLIADMQGGRKRHDRSLEQARSRQRIPRTSLA
jgi:hypothetical protein